MDYAPPSAYHAEMHQAPTRCPFLFQEDVVQHGMSDFSNAVRVERGITIDQALQIALEDPDIDYFFYTKGACMVLAAPSDILSDPLGLVSSRPGVGGVENHRIFYKGDTVFFSGDGLMVGESLGLSDIYHKTMHALGPKGY